MKKLILLFTVIFITNCFIVSANPESVMMLGDCNSSDSKLNYVKFELLNLDTTQSLFASALYIDCNFNLNIYSLVKKVDKLYDIDTTYSFDDMGIELMYEELDTLTSVFEVVGELYYTSDSLSKGLIYLAPALTYSDTLNIMDIDDTTQIYQSNAIRRKYNGYLVSWEGETDYSNQYDSTEIQEVLIFTSNGNSLYLIEDTDRSNKVVGLKYYSVNNAILYERYFEPNN